MSSPLGIDAPTTTLAPEGGCTSWQLAMPLSERAGSSVPYQHVAYQILPRFLSCPTLLGCFPGSSHWICKIEVRPRIEIRMLSKFLIIHNSVKAIWQGQNDDNWLPIPCRKPRLQRLPAISAGCKTWFIIFGHPRSKFLWSLLVAELKKVRICVWLIAFHDVNPTASKQ